VGTAAAISNLVWLVLIGSTVWVGVDVYNLRKRLGGQKIAGMGAFAWVLCCILMWIVAFPYYLAKRSGAIHAGGASSAGPPPGWWRASDGRWYPPSAPPSYPSPPDWPPG